MPNTYFITLFKDFKKIIESESENNYKNNYKNKLDKNILTQKSPMRKIKSEEDFVKLQVPWIL